MQAMDWTVAQILGGVKIPDLKNLPTVTHKKG